MHRFEHKYRLSGERARAIEARCRQWMGFDPHSAAQGPAARYVVRSLYFDTHNLAAYYDKLSGLLDRAKVRIRAYGPATGPGDAVFLELKQRADALVNKVRYRMPDELAQRARVDHGTRMLTMLRRSKVLPDPLQRALMTPGLRPTVLVVYERVAFAAPGPGRLRITLDYDARARTATRVLDLDQAPGLRGFTDGDTILEIKYSGNAPAFVSTLVNSFDLQLRAVSKYAMGMEKSAPLASARRGLMDEGLTGLSAALLYHAPRRAP